MDYLLDTHTLLWYLDGDASLSPPARDMLEHKDNKKILSIASLWEIAIKISLGKLQIKFNSFDDFLTEIYQYQIKILDIQPKTLQNVSVMPFHHKDPFDRIIIAHALFLKLPVISRDDVFDKYDIERVW